MHIVVKTTPCCRHHVSRSRSTAYSDSLFIGSVVGLKVCSLELQNYWSHAAVKMPPSPQCTTLGRSLVEARPLANYQWKTPRIFHFCHLGPPLTLRLPAVSAGCVGSSLHGTGPPPSRAPKPSTTAHQGYGFGDAPTHPPIGSHWCCSDPSPFIT